jgi:hypothetical protein
MRKPMNVRILFLCAALAATVPLLAVSPLPPYTYWPCNPALSTTGCPIDKYNCYSYRSYPPDAAMQFRVSQRSPRSTQTPSSWGICNSFSDYCRQAPQVTGATYTVVPGAGGTGRDVILEVTYDFPDSYCQIGAEPFCNFADFPPTHILGTPLTRLQLVEGTHLIDEAAGRRASRSAAAS